MFSAKWQPFYLHPEESTHWGGVTYICVGKLTIIGSGNGLSPERRQAIIWTNAGILLIAPLGENFNEISIEIHGFSLTKIHLKMSSGKCWSFCLGLNVLRGPWTLFHQNADYTRNPGAHFTHDFSIIIHIWRKFSLGLNQIQIQRSIKKNVYDQTTVLSR